MTTEGWLPPEVDVRTPNIGRMYDFYLGGKDNFDADRRAALEVALAVPSVVRLARENRAFLGRAVRFMIGVGIDQFIDVGTGLPTQGHVHQVTEDACPGARVVYVDNEPVVLAHARARIPANDRTAVVAGDMRKPEEIIDHPATRRLIDFSRPVGVLLVAMLHFASDADDPASIMAAFTKRLMPGSAVAISHVTRDGPPRGALAQAEAVYQSTTASVIPRTRRQIKGLFAGLNIVRPGVVYVPEWRPPTDDRPRPDSRWLLGGVGVVPARHRSASKWNEAL